MTNQQANWAAQHDWYRHTTLATNGARVVWCNSQRPEGGLVPFNDYYKLRIWAGY